MIDNGDQLATGLQTENNAEEPKQKATKLEDPSQASVKARNEEKVPLRDVVYRTGLVAAKTVTGVAVGAAVGIGAVVAITAAEVVLPALLVIKTFAFAGGALGFLKGVSRK
jgi:hypothetical protein